MSSGPQGSRPSSSRGAKVRLAVGCVVVAALIVARLVLVHQGVLFGASRILQVDVVIGIALLGVTAAWYRVWTRRTDAGGTDSSTLVGTVAGILGVPALAAALLNLVAPPTPGELAAPACATAQTYKTAFRAVTVGPDGNFARSGPGLGFTQTDRFSKGCVVGFSGYCIGDPIPDPLFKGWNDSRWLLASAHRDGWQRWAARVLSSEPQHARFVSTSYLRAQSAESRSFRHLGEDQCEGGLPMPGKPTLTSEPTREPGVFAVTADAPHAFNIGVALVVDPGNLRTGAPMRQIPGSGKVDPSGKVTAQWDYRVLRGHLKAPEVKTATVTVLAVPCLDPQAPAEEPATIAFVVPADATKPVRQVKPTPLTPNVEDRLRSIACDPEQTVTTADAVKD